jgi:hypothetical protein
MTSANRYAAHSELKKAIKLALGGRPECRLFDNPRGHARNPETGAHVYFGLAPGASDLVGIVKPRGRWIALEVKTGKAVASAEQLRFLELIRNMGGIGRIVRSVDEALEALAEAAT